jgi:hypothetical protein
LRCTAVQIQRNIVVRQLDRTLHVPRKCGSGCHCAGGDTVSLPNGWSIALG